MPTASVEHHVPCRDRPSCQLNPDSGELLERRNIQPQQACTDTARPKVCLPANGSDWPMIRRSKMGQSDPVHRWTGFETESHTLNEVKERETYPLYKCCEVLTSVNSWARSPLLADWKTHGSVDSRAPVLRSVLQMSFLRATMQNTTLCEQACYGCS